MEPIKLLQDAAAGFNIVHSTVLDFDTTQETGGILNIPFIVNTANASEMRSILWIHELADKDDHGDPVMIIQYAQIVMLDFFRRRDGAPGLIKWPHVSINTMRRATKKPVTFAQMLNEGIDPLKPVSRLA